MPIYNGLNQWRLAAVRWNDLLGGVHRFTFWVFEEKQDAAYCIDSSDGLPTMNSGNKLWPPAQ